MINYNIFIFNFLIICVNKDMICTLEMRGQLFEHLSQFVSQPAVNSGTVAPCEPSSH